jgi:hypothetical protein
MIYSVDLYWLPLGTGGHFVRLNGRNGPSEGSGAGDEARTRDPYLILPFDLATTPNGPRCARSGLGQMEVTADHRSDPPVLISSDFVR